MSVETFYNEMQVYGEYDTVDVELVNGAMHVRFDGTPDGLRRQFESLGTDKYGLDMTDVEGTGDFVVFE